VTLLRMARSAMLLLALGAGTMGGALAERVDFTPAERQRILSLGPWPPPAARDAGNAVAGRAHAIALGRRLFFDPRLSIDGSRSCASCHVPGLAFTDGRTRAIGQETLDRNTPTLWNAVHERWYGWDGAADSLWSQALRPLQDPREMGADLGHLSRVVAGDADLACRWRRSFGQAPTVDDERTLVELGKAIGAFVGSLVSAPTAFDGYRDALQRGDLKAAARYPAAAQRGLKIFVGRGRCQLCHGGPRFRTASSPTSACRSSSGRAWSTLAATRASWHWAAAPTTCYRAGATTPPGRPR
jgi:cytochrome c peroxidase